MKIKVFQYNHSRNDENYQYYSNLRSLLAEYDSLSKKITALVSAFLKCLEIEDDVLKKIAANTVTFNVNMAVRQRKKTYRAMMTAHKSMSMHFDSEVVEAARRLKVVFNSYGNLAKKPLNEETSGIYNLVQELRKNYSEDLQDTKLNDWIDRLEGENYAVDSILMQRDKQTASKTKLKMKDVRTNTDKAYLAILERLNAMIVMEGEAEYEDFVAQYNVLTDRFNHAIAQRRGRAKAKKAAEGEEEPKDKDSKG